MPGSGWGMEDDAGGGWIANRDFNFRNLSVRKGDRLPSSWQVPQNRAYLKERYGEDCILFKNAKRGRPDDEGRKPSRKEAAGAKSGSK